MIAKRIKKLENTDGSSPISKIIVHKISKILLMVRSIYSLIVQTFLNTFIKLTIPINVNIRPHILKKNPGGITYKKYFFDIYALRVPYNWMNRTVPPKKSKLRILIGHDLDPRTPSFPVLLSYSISTGYLEFSLFR
jgi:hypothetical protein